MYHTAQTAILSEIGEGWASAAELTEKLGKWTFSTIRTELRRLHRQGILFKRLDIVPKSNAPRFWFWTARYTRRRDPLEALNLVIPKREAARRGALYCSCCGLPKEPVDAE